MDWKIILLRVTRARHGASLVPLLLRNFCPETWERSILRFQYSHSESMNKPLYVPGTDILVEEEGSSLHESTINIKNAEDVTGSI